MWMVVRSSLAISRSVLIKIKQATSRWLFYILIKIGKEKNEMNILNMKDLIGGVNAVSYDAAQKVYPKIEEALKKGVVELDFSGIKILSSPFLNATVGLLLKERSIKELKETVMITNLPLGGEDTLSKVMENAEICFNKK